MSYTELYKFKKDGSAEVFAEIKNAWRGAMAIWDILDERYLPPFVPQWAIVMNEQDKRHYRMADISGESSKEIWALFENEKVSTVDKIVLGSTFDNVVVMRDDLPKLVKSFRDFEGETSLKEQADAIEKAYNEDDDLIAIGWNQTSVNADAWTSGELQQDDEGEEFYPPYNLLTGKKHWSLFQQATV